MTMMEVSVHLEVRRIVRKSKESRGTTGSAWHEQPSLNSGHGKSPGKDSKLLSSPPRIHFPMSPSRPSHAAVVYLGRHTVQVKMRIALPHKPFIFRWQMQLNH